MAKKISAERKTAGAPAWSWHLHVADQACCAVLLCASLALMMATWAYQGGLSGRFVDVEKAAGRRLTFQIDVNESDWPEWSLLPGIGEMLARRITESRRASGAFRSHEDLLRVHGIGPRKLDQIRPFLLPIVPAPDDGRPDS